MRWKQILGWVAIAFLAFEMLTNAGQVGHFVHDILHTLQGAGHQAGSFLNKSKS